MFNVDGETVFTVDPTGVLRLWNTSTGQPTGLVVFVDDFLALSPDRRTLATVTPDHVIRLWDMATGQPLFALGRDGGELIIFGPDGRTAIVTNSDNVMRLWQVRSTGPTS